MFKNSTFFFTFITVILLIIVGYRYQEYVQKRNFLIDVNVSCNPVIESCFVADCQSESDCDNVPYKKIELLAKDASLCLEEHNCKDFSCSIDNGCITTYCSNDTIVESEKCVELIP